MSDIATPLPSTAIRSDAANAGLAVLAAAVPASLLCALVAVIAHGAGASSQFRPLQAGTFVPLVVLGVVGGAIGWSVIRRRSQSAGALLSWLVPLVLVVSFVPDVLLGAGGSMPGTSWGAVSALMVMHLVVAGCAVAAYRHFLPISRR